MIKQQEKISKVSGLKKNISEIIRTTRWLVRCLDLLHPVTRGIGGLEDSYNDELNGIDGKEYGYVNSDSNYEIKVKDATDGNTIVSTIDANLQSITESKIAEFNDAMKDGSHEGAKNIGVIMMDPNSGEVLAMATNRTFSLQDTVECGYK